MKNYSNKILIFLLTIQLVGCSKGGMFGGALSGFLSAGGSTGTKLKNVASSSSMYTDMELNINKTNNTVLAYLDSNVGLSNINSDQEYLDTLNDLNLNYDPTCVHTDTATNTTTYTCDLDSTVVQAMVTGSSSSSALSSSGYQAVASTAPILRTKSSKYTFRQTVLSKFKEVAAQGITIDSTYIADTNNELGALCADPQALDSNGNSICSFLITDVSVTDEPTVFKVYEHLNLRDDQLTEFKHYVKYDLAQTDEYKDIIKVDNSELVALMKKKARREFLQVNSNALLSHGVNLFSFLTFFGYNITNSSNSSFFNQLHLNSSELNTIYTNNKNKPMINTFLINNVLNRNKPAFYFFVEKFLTEEDMSAVEGSDTKYEYKLNAQNLCKHLAGGSSGCTTVTQTYLNRIKIIQDIETKSVKMTYLDSPYVPTEKVLATLYYTYDYKSKIQVDLSDFKTIVIAFLKHEIDADPSGTASSSHVDQTDVDFLQAMTLTGVVSLNDRITVPTDSSTDQDSIVDISKTNMASKLGLSVDSDFFLRVPEVADPTTFQVNAYNLGIVGSNEGDVVMSVPAVENFFSLTHDRSTTIYDDVIGLNLPTIDFKFPPYDISSRDLLVLEGAIDPNCNDWTENQVCNSKLRLSKLAVNNSMDMAYAHLKHYASNRVDFDNWAMGLSPVDLQFFIPVDTSVTSTSTINRKVAGDISLTPFKSYVLYPAKNHNMLGENLTLSYPNYVDGTAEYTIDSRNNLTLDTSFNVAADGQGNYPLVYISPTLNLIDANASNTIYKHCNIPMDFNGSQSLSTAAVGMLMNVMQGTYSGQYACAQ